MKSKIPSIGEKVKFWVEQDKINNALIPRFLADHKQIMLISQETVKLSDDLSKLTVKQLEMDKMTQDVERISASITELTYKLQENDKRIEEFSGLLNNLLSRSSSPSSTIKKGLLPIILSILAFVVSVLSIFIVIF